LRAGRLDDMVRRILRGVFAVGLFDDPVKPHPIDVAAGAVVAGRIEHRAAVLLRNSHGALPLDATKGGSLAVIGSPPAGPPPLAGFPSSADVVPIFPDTALAAIRQRARGAAVRYADGTDVAAAAALARRSRVAIVFARDIEGESYNRPNLDLPGNADALIRAV